MASNPSLIHITSEIQHYDSVEQEIQAIKPVIAFESVQLTTGDFYL